MDGFDFETSFYVNYFDFFESRCMTLLMPLTDFVAVDEIVIFRW